MKIESTEPDIDTIINRLNKKIYVLESDFQRDYIWNLEKKQKLIDSIVRKWHVPPIHLVKIEGSDKYDVLDGKQRLSSIWDFVKDKFSFNGNFLPESDDFSGYHNKKYSQLPSQIKEIINNSSIRVYIVTDIRKNEATELFLRLNQGVTVVAPEKRNCIYGDVKDFLREIQNTHKILFNPKTLGFENRRMAYQDSIDKIVFLEKQGNLEQKPTSNSLEKMYFEHDINEKLKNNLIEYFDITEKTLNGFSSNYGFKLTKSTLISYYWFLRELRRNGEYNEKSTIQFLIKFESWKKEQESYYESDKSVSRKFIEFNNYLTKGWLDPSSLKGRQNILLDLYIQFKKTDKIEA